MSEVRPSPTGAYKLAYGVFLQKCSSLTAREYVEEPGQCGGCLQKHGANHKSVRDAGLVLQFGL